MPTLVLDNVEARNILYDYDSLVNVQNDNYMVKKDAIFKDELTLILMGNYKI